MKAPHINQFRERAQQGSVERDRRRAVLLAAMAEDRELYSVTAAQLLALEGWKGASAAKALLEQLERDGLVVSRIASAPRAWKRRYYRLAPPG